MAISRLGRRQQVIQQRHGLWRNRNLRGFASGKSFRFLLLCLVLIAILPPIFFHFKLRHFHQIQLRKCGWLNNPPLVCAHGGDSTKAFPNTIAEKTWQADIPSWDSDTSNDPSDGRKYT
ncbi:hypothetical protein HYC85_016950 [Camellia sinensis]|uniref:Uncharacterized protein n=1 Tax=Camellia sinensis TaxID=4442 RepID=A0A7J7H142_CAMSI|nr:hypothetical protein HYC85_016950 [Camellia sinensis]